MGETYWAVFAGNDVVTTDRQRDAVIQDALQLFHQVFPTAVSIDWKALKKLGYRCRKVKVTPHE